MWELARGGRQALQHPPEQDAPTVLRIAVKELVIEGVYELREGMRRHGLLRRMTAVPVLVATGKSAPADVPLGYVDETIRELLERDRGTAGPRVGGPCSPTRRWPTATSTTSRPST